MFLFYFPMPLSSKACLNLSTKSSGFEPNHHLCDFFIIPSVSGIGLQGGQALMELKNYQIQLPFLYSLHFLADFLLPNCHPEAWKQSVDDMSHIDLESGRHQRSVTGSDVSIEDSVYFSDADEDSCYSQFFSTNGGSYDEYRFALGFSGILWASQKASSPSDSSVEVKIESGVAEIKAHLAKVERDCRICHLGLESNSRESGIPIELGCSCKEDLAAAHKQCAETWFKIKGNKTCEICHSIARNVLVAHEIELMERTNETGNASSIASAPAPTPPVESQRFWSGRRFLNFLLVCMVFAFVISWLFHFNVPS